MKSMKRVLCGLMVCLMIAMLGACGGKEQSATCTSNQEGMTQEIKMYATGDSITKWVQTTTISVEGIDSETIDAAIQVAKDNYAPFEHVDYKAEVNGTEFKEVITIDMTDSQTIKDLVEAELMPVEGNAERISYKATLESFRSQGWTVVED